MLRRAEVLAKSELVPKPLQDKPEAIMVIGVWGAEHGISLMTAINEVHVIENRPSPSAQLRLALLRRAGHEARFTESTSERATIRGRRREYRDDPDAWVTVTWTVDDARRAGLLDQWVQRWNDKRLERFVVGDDRGMAGLKDAPDWARKLVAAGDVRSKDNWQKYPAEMLRARAASALCRMEFSDVLAAFGAHPHTAEELGDDIGQDIDEPAELADGVDDAELVDPPAGGLRPDAPPADGVAPGEAGLRPPAPPGAAAPLVERDDVVAVKARLNAMTPRGRHDMRVWMAARKPPIPDSIDATEAEVAAVNAELDRRAAGEAEAGGLHHVGTAAQQMLEVEES
jgi:hypothetical protein